MRSLRKTVKHYNILIISRGVAIEEGGYDKVITVKSGSNNYIYLENDIENYRIDVVLKQGDFFEIRENNSKEGEFKRIEIEGEKGYSNQLSLDRNLFQNTKEIIIRGITLSITTPSSISRFEGGEIVLENNHIQNRFSLYWGASPSSSLDMLCIIRGNNFKGEGSIIFRNVDNNTIANMEVVIEENYITSAGSSSLSITNLQGKNNINILNNKFLDTSSILEVDFETKGEGEITLFKNVFSSFQNGRLKIDSSTDTTFSIQQNKFLGMDLKGRFHEGGNRLGGDISIKDNSFEYKEEVEIIFDANIFGEVLITGNTFKPEQANQFTRITLSHTSASEVGEELRVGFSGNMIQGKRVTISDLQRCLLIGNIIDTEIFYVLPMTYNLSKKTPFLLRANMFQDNKYKLKELSFYGGFIVGEFPPEIQLIGNRTTSMKEEEISVWGVELNSRGNKWG